MKFIRTIEPEMVQLKSIVNRKFGLDINYETRKRDYVNARLVYAKILRERGYTFESIAHSIGKDHATVIYYVKCALNIFKQDRFLEKKYNECRTSFFGDIDPMLNPSSEEMLTERVQTLTQEVETLTKRNEILEFELNEKKKTFRRLNRIINLIEERTHYGKEEIIEKKIREMFNGLSQ